MEREIAIDEARELVSNPVLWPRVRDFLWDFAPQVHPSWLEGLKIGGLESFQALKLSGSRIVKRFILETLEVEPFFHDFPKDDWSRLALLDGVTLESIIKWSGALACAGSLRRVMDGATVRSLKTALSGVYPDVFSYTAYFKGLGDANADSNREPETQNLTDTVMAVGCDMLLSTVAGCPAQLVERMKLKLPKNLCASAPLGKMKFPQEACARLLKLKFSEAYSLCC